MNIKALRAQVLKLRESIPAKKKPFVVIFENADGTMSGDNAARLRAAKAANAHIINVRFMRTPSEELSL
jgi:polyphosphate kinase 2 (PPK2 family)